MTTLQTLITQAINASAQGNWESGISINENILELEPTNIAAKNRLAFCHMQQGNVELAQQLYTEVLGQERLNPIAQKYLGMLKQKVRPQATAFHRAADFIEEPGKTKSVPLVRLADPDILQAIPTATVCKLVARNHRVNVQTDDGKYLGALPDDVAYRLHKLLASGNEYLVLVQSTSKKHCTVFIKETRHSPTAIFASSFPVSNGQRSPSIQEDVLLDEAPLDTRETGDEVDTSDAEEDAHDLME